MKLFLPALLVMFAVFGYYKYFIDKHAMSVYETKFVIFYPNHLDTVVIKSDYPIEKVYGNSGIVLLRKKSFGNKIIFQSKSDIKLLSEIKIK